MKELLSMLLFITCLCRAQTGRVDYYEIKPYPVKIDNNEGSVTLYSHNKLEVMEAYPKEGGGQYKIVMAGNVLKDWFTDDDSKMRGGDTFIRLLYSPKAKDYYFFQWQYFEEYEWIRAFHITEKTVTFEGQFSYDLSDPVYFFDKDSKHEGIEKINIQEVYTENGKLHIADFIGVDGIERVIKYNIKSSVNFYPAKGIKNFESLKAQLDKKNSTLRFDANLDSDDITEHYAIDWKARKIAYLDNAAKELQEMKMQSAAIAFKQDTLIISEYFYDRMPLPEYSSTYINRYYFVASPYDNNPLLHKHVSSKEIEKYEKENAPYSFTYYPIHDTRLSDFQSYRSEQWEYAYNSRYRIFTLKEIESKLKDNSDYYITSELPPSPYEMYVLLQKEPLTTQNVTRYNNVAFYLEQLILTHISKMEYAQSSPQYSLALSTATYLLEKILERFPERTVAHLNMADILWNDYDKLPAKKYYNSYIALMKKENKQAKIPQRVYDRLKK